MTNISNQKPWVIVINPCAENECIYAEFDTFLHAMDYREAKMKNFNLDFVDVAKRTPTGSITFDY